MVSKGSSEAWQWCPDPDGIAPGNQALTKVATIPTEGLLPSCRPVTGFGREASGTARPTQVLDKANAEF